MTLSPEAVKKQSLQWQEELKVQRDRLGQAQSVVADATQKIAMIEGGLQFASSLTQAKPAPETEPAYETSDNEG
tara:strand:- start:432 stop:653 length:222 start_codon:yes stop_codon:yes gene_type:complete